MTVKDYKHLLLIARDAPWRLNQRQLTKGLNSLRVRYYSLLSDRSLVGYNSKLRTDKFRQALRRTFVAGMSASQMPQIQTMTLSKELKH